MEFARAGICIYTESSVFVFLRNLNWGSQVKRLPIFYKQPIVINTIFDLISIGIITNIIKCTNTPVLSRTPSLINIFLHFQKWGHFVFVFIFKFYDIVIIIKMKPIMYSGICIHVLKYLLQIYHITFTYTIIVYLYIEVVHLRLFTTHLLSLSANEWLIASTYPFPSKLVFEKKLLHLRFNIC